MPYNIKNLENCLNNLYGVHNEDYKVVYYIYPYNNIPHIWKAEFINGIYYRNTSYLRLSHFFTDNNLNLTPFLAYMENHIEPHASYNIDKIIEI